MDPLWRQALRHEAQVDRGELAALFLWGLRKAYEHVVRTILWTQRVELLLEAIKTEVWGVRYTCYDNALELTAPLVVILVLAFALRWSVGPCRL